MKNLIYGSFSLTKGNLVFRNLRQVFPAGRGDASVSLSQQKQTNNCRSYCKCRMEYRMNFYLRGPNLRTFVQKFKGKSRESANNLGGGGGRRGKSPREPSL